MKKYGEIYFLGKCNCKCFYCIGNEISESDDEEATKQMHPWELRNFDRFLKLLHENSYDTVYLSSVKTEPLLYRHIDEMIDILIEQGFKVGIRTNGYLYNMYRESFYKMEEEISFSVQGMTSSVNHAICGVYTMPDWEFIFQDLREHHKKCRVTMVINQQNKEEFFDLLDLCAKYNDVVTYVQGRRMYREDGEVPLYEEVAFKVVKKQLTEKSKYLIPSFGGSFGYNWFSDKALRKIDVYLWEKPFEKNTISPINYFVNGQITTACHIVLGKEKHHEEIAM